MDGAIVKLDALADADGAGAQNQHLFAIFCFFCLTFTAKDGIIVRGRGGKLCSAGIYHFINSHNTVVVTHLLNLCRSFATEFGNNRIREFNALGFF